MRCFMTLIGLALAGGTGTAFPNGGTGGSTPPVAVERKGTAISDLPLENPINAKNLTEEILREDKGVDLRKLPAPPFKPAFDSTNFQADTKDIGTPCFTSIGPWIDVNRERPTESQFQQWRKLQATKKYPVTESEFERTMTCEGRDSLVKAFAFTSVFLKGTSYTCVFVPLPQAQIAAKVFDIASYASSTIGLVIATTHCENKLEQKFNALLKACDELKAMNIDCQGVDDTPF